MCLAGLKNQIPLPRKVWPPLTILESHSGAGTEAAEDDTCQGGYGHGQGRINCLLFKNQPYNYVITLSVFPVVCYSERILTDFIQ